jgi:hypothetical protein
MSVNIITFGKRFENLKRAIEHSTIGSYQTTFSTYLKNGSIIFLHCRSLVWGTAKVTSDYFYSDKVIWEDKVYPHRFLISNIRLVAQPLDLSNGYYNLELRKQFGTAWAYKFIFSPKPLPSNLGLEILSDLELRPEQTNAKLDLQNLSSASSFAQYSPSIDLLVANHK